MKFHGIDSEEARRLCERWLPAWTGNNPTGLAEFYTDDAFYRDGATGPQGVQGKTALLIYFTKLLQRNPCWVWRHRRSIPLEDGFLNFWSASIPVGPRIVEAEGVCSVQLRGGLIYRNEVFFDRHELLGTMSRQKLSWRPFPGA